MRGASKMANAGNCSWNRDGRSLMSGIIPSIGVGRTGIGIIYAKGSTVINPLIMLLLRMPHEELLNR